MATNKNSGAALVKVRSAAKVSGLAKKVFSPGVTAFTAAQITADFRLAFQTAGIDLPLSVLIPLDAGQMILAGGVFVSDLNQGKTILQSASPLAMSISGLTNLLSDLGILDPQFADFAALGSNGLIAIASGGANVLADIGCVLSLVAVVGDLGSDFGGSYAAAKSSAFKALNTGIKAYLNPQIAYATSQVVAFQKGQLNPFDLISNVALNSPALFKNFFPDLATYFPNWISETITGYGESSGMFSSQDDAERKSFIALATTKKQIETVLIQKYVTTPMQEFIKDQISSKCISLKALSVIGMIMATATGEAPVIGFDFDIISVCAGLGLTPSILGDDWVFEGGASHEDVFQGDNFDPNSMLPYAPLTLKPAVTGASTGGLVINGKTQLTAADKANLDYAAALKEFQYQLYLADKNGDVEGLCKNNEAVALMKNWAVIDITPTWGPLSQEPIGMALKAGCIPISLQPWFEYAAAQYVGRAPPGQSLIKTNGRAANTQFFKKNFNPQQYIDYVQKYYLIDLSNYWKCLQCLSTMRKSKILKDDALALSVWGDLDEIQALFKKVYAFVIAKNLNKNAQKNVASYIGTTPDKLAARLDTAGNKVFYQKAG